MFGQVRVPTLEESSIHGAKSYDTVLDCWVAMSGLEHLALPERRVEVPTQVANGMRSEEVETLPLFLGIEAQRWRKIYGRL